MAEQSSQKRALTVITGASRGLGAALVNAFLRHGDVIGVATHFPVEETGPFEGVVADLTSQQGIDAVVRQVGGRKVDVLINNAGILGPRVPIADYPPADWDRVLAINLTAPFRLTQGLLPHMRRPGGCILNVGSGAGRRAAPEWGAYAVSKFGTDGFSLLLAEELKETGIRVHSINPGAMRTRMRAAAYPQEDPQTVSTPDQVAPFFTEVAFAEIDDHEILLNAPR